MRKILLPIVFGLFLVGIVMVPNAIAQTSTNGNLSVSSERASSVMVIEIIVDDPNISDTTVAQTEPLVYVQGNSINMVQATDGKWYAYIADTSGVKWADSTVTTPGIGFDYGEFCSSGTDSSELGMDLTGLSGVAIARPYVGTSSSTNGEATFQACSGGSVSSGAVLNNVVRNPPTLVSGAVPIGQIGIADNIFPVIQLMEFNSSMDVSYGPDSLSFDFGLDDDYSLGVTMCSGSSDIAAMGDDFCLLTLPPLYQLSIDPTSKDIWTFTVVHESSNTDSELYYRLFDSSGNAEADGNNPTDLNPFFVNLGFEDRPTIKIDENNFSSAFGSVDCTQLICLQPMSNQFQSLDANGNSVSLSSTQQFITVIETENNSSVFTTLDSNGDSSVSTGIFQIGFYQLKFTDPLSKITHSIELYTRPPAFVSQTFTIQEDTMAVIPLSFNNDLTSDVYAIIDSDHHAAYMRVYKDGPNHWDQYFLQFDGEAGFISQHYLLRDLDIGDQINGQDLNRHNEYVFVYIPLLDFTGTDEFSIFLRNSNHHGGFESDDSATITVNVTPVNDPPLTLGGDSYWVSYDERGDIDSFSTSEDTPVQVLLSGFDPDGDSLSFEIVTQPAHGTLTEATPYPSDQHDHCEFDYSDGVSQAGQCPHPPGHVTKSYLYTPDSDYSWTECCEPPPESFTYRINDGTTDSVDWSYPGYGNYINSGTPTMAIYVHPINDIPVANAGPDQSVNPGDIVELDGTQSYDVDLPMGGNGYPELGIGSNDQLTYSWIQTAGNPVTLTSSTILSPQFTAPSQAGQLTFMLTLNDGVATSNPDVVNIYVGESIPEPTTAPPPGSVASSASNSQVILNWTTPSDDGGATITDYMVEYIAADGEFWLVYDDGTSTTTSATVSGLTNGQEYQFRISAINSVGIGDASSTTSATPSVAPELPPEEEPEVEIEPEVEPEIIPEEPEMVPEPVMEPEPQMESEATQSSAGCGSGTVLVDGVCELAPTQQPTQQSSQGCGPGTVLVDGKCELVQESELKGTSVTMPAFEPLYIIVAAVAVGGAVAAIFVIKKGSGGAKPARQEPRRTLERPTERVETSTFCQGCGAELKPEAKFCGKCGTPVS